MDVLVENVMPKQTTKTASFQLTNLSPFSNMQLQICVMNTYYVGPPSDPIGFNTVEGGTLIVAVLIYIQGNNSAIFIFAALFNGDYSLRKEFAPFGANSFF